MNFKKRKHFIKIDKDYIYDPKDLRASSATLYKTGTIDCKDLISLIQAGVSIFVNYGTETVAFCPSQKRASFKKIDQYKNSLNKKRKLAQTKILLSKRNTYYKALGLPTLALTDVTLNAVMLKEAVWMKRIYNILARRHGIEWKGKNDTSKDHNFHLQFKWLYHEIHACLLQMNLDPNIGIIHSHNGHGLIYDIADCFKILFIDAKFANKTAINERYLFNDVYKKHRLRVEIPLLIKKILL